MIIKCCGLNPSRDVKICLDLKVNFLGFIFYEKSPRNIKISDLDILKSYNRKNSLFTAVTVNANNDLIDQIILKELTVDITLQSNKTIPEGRRIPKDSAVPEPRLFEMVEASKQVRKFSSLNLD